MPGSSLLNDNDSRLLESFWHSVDANEFGGSMFQDSGEFLDGLGTTWNDPPPMFVGSSTSYGQQPQFMSGDIHNAPFATDLNGMNAMPSHMLPQTTPADVLAAASVLQNGHNGRSNSDAIFTIPTSTAAQQRSLSQSQMMPFSRPDAFLTDMVFGADHGRGDQRVSKPVDINWGSDAGFAARRFIAPAGQETMEAITENKLQALDCFEFHGGSTAENTRPNSPILTRHIDVNRRQSMQRPDPGTAMQDDPRPIKRRKSSLTAHVDQEPSSPASASKASKKRRIKSAPESDTAVPADSTKAATPTTKSRKSNSVSAAKPPRENLTDDQKRENHIRSEQKRRTLIKEGFDDLNELVPDLRAGGFSKSAVLEMTAAFLSDLIDGNKELRDQLAKLKRGG